MQIDITNFRAIGTASIAADPIALVYGPNQAGKSSVLLASAACLTGAALPVDKMTKAMANQFVRAGLPASTATVALESGSVSVEWPSCDVSSEGQRPPRASRVAAGLNSLCDPKAKDRRAELSALIMRDPTADEIAAELVKAGINEAKAKDFGAKIAESGWDQVLKDLQDTIRKTKGKWEHVTGENFGAAKVKTWVPAGWDDELAAAQKVDLDAAIQRAKEAYDALNRDGAVAADRITQARALADSMPALTEAVQRAKEANDAAVVALEKARAHSASLPRPDDSAIPCPSCGTHLVYRPKTGNIPPMLTATETQVDATKLKAARLAIADAEGTVSRLVAERDAAGRALNTAEADLARAEAAAAWLEKNGNAGTVDAAALAAAKEAATTAEARRAAREAYEMAQTYANMLDKQNIAAGLIGPDDNGIRAKRMKQALKDFNATLDLLTKAAGWDQVRITDDMDVLIGGRPYEALGGVGGAISSMQWKARVTIQVATARLDGSDAVLIEGADILDARGRGGLLGMLYNHFDGAALVAMTAGPKAVIDIGASGYGASYWIEAGDVLEYGDAVAVGVLPDPAQKAA